MQHPDEGMIHTWLDGEFSAEEAAALEAQTNASPTAATTATFMRKSPRQKRKEILDRLRA